MGVMLRAWVLICFLLLHFYCTCLGLAMLLLPPALIVAFTARARVAGHELFVAVVRLGWSLVPWEFLEYAGEWEAKFATEKEREREEESWCQYDAVLDNLLLVKPVVRA